MYYFILAISCCVQYKILEANTSSIFSNPSEKNAVTLFKKWRSVNDEDDEDTLNILLSVPAASGSVSYAKERKSRGPNGFHESGW